LANFKGRYLKGVTQNLNRRNGTFYGNIKICSTLKVRRWYATKNIKGSPISYPNVLNWVTIKYTFRLLRRSGDKDYIIIMKELIKNVENVKKNLIGITISQKI
jgi:hypothetical protein